MSSSWTILMTCCAGLRLFCTSAPFARSFKRPMSVLTTRTLTSASRSASRISRATASTSASVSFPRLRSREKIPSKRSERASNMVRRVYGPSTCPRDPPGPDARYSQVPGEVGREPQYEIFADEFLDHAEDGFYNAHFDRPACLDLLGDVRGRRVLDAACGPGLYAEALVRRGATVTGFDHSPGMVELAAARVPAGRFRTHDLNDALDWIDDGAFDLALCALAIEYVDDRAGALRELRRVLTPGGALVLSRPHPTIDWIHHGGSYFETERRRGDLATPAGTCGSGSRPSSGPAPRSSTPAS